MNTYMGAVIAAHNHNLSILNDNQVKDKKVRKSNMRNFEEMKIISDYERIQECRKWMKEIPVLHFDKEWDVKIIPPFGGAVIRFWINYKDKHVSVYFDAYSELGWMVDENENPIPYFEYYDGEDCYRYYMNESEKMMEDIRNFLDN